VSHATPRLGTTSSPGLGHAACGRRRRRRRGRGRVAPPRRLFAQSLMMILCCRPTAPWAPPPRAVLITLASGLLGGRGPPGSVTLASARLSSGASLRLRYVAWSIVLVASCHRNPGPIALEYLLSRSCRWSCAQDCPLPRTSVIKVCLEFFFCTGAVRSIRIWRQI
jgi:hypothetical protein